MYTAGQITTFGSATERNSQKEIGDKLRQHTQTNREETDFKTQELSTQLRAANTKLSQHQRLNLPTAFQGERHNVNVKIKVYAPESNKLLHLTARLSVFQEGYKEFTLLKGMLVHCLALLSLTPEHPRTKVTVETEFTGGLHARYWSAKGERILND